MEDRIEMTIKTIQSTPKESKSFSAFNVGDIVFVDDMSGRKIVRVSSPTGSREGAFSGQVQDSGNSEEIGTHSNGWAKSVFQPYVGSLMFLCEK